MRNVLSFMLMAAVTLLVLPIACIDRVVASVRGVRRKAWERKHVKKFKLSYYENVGTDTEGM